MNKEEVKKAMQKYEIVENGLQEAVTNAGTSHLFLESIMKIGDSEKTRMAVIYHSRVHQGYGKISLLFDMFHDDMVTLSGETIEEVYTVKWLERFSNIIKEQHENLEELIKLVKK
nr:MAG TPA: hypothetical protein [Caudoviricetes sp.]